MAQDMFKRTTTGWWAAAAAALLIVEVESLSELADFSANDPFVRHEVYAEVLCVKKAVIFNVGCNIRIATETFGKCDAVAARATHDAQVADSAPTATAMVSGVKSVNGTIGVTQNIKVGVQATNLLNSRTYLDVGGSKSRTFTLTGPGSLSGSTTAGFTIKK